MSLKRVRKYYDQICEQYQEMIKDIQDLEKEAADGLVEPERIDRLKEQVEPLKQNYQRWSYMMFLLNEPARKEKRENYKKRNKKFLASLDPCNSIEAVIEENTLTIAQIGE